MNRGRILLHVALSGLISAMSCGMHNAWAAEMKETWTIEGGRSVVPDLVCPRIQKPAAPSRSSNAEDLAPPQPDTIAALAPLPDDSGITEPLPMLPRSGDTPPSVAIWGDSHTAAGYFSEQLVDSIGLSQDEALPSFLPPTVSRPGVRLPLRKSCRGGPWRTDLAYTSSATGATFGRALTRAANTGPGAFIWFDLRRNAGTPNVKELEILVSPPNGDASATLKVTVDDAETRSFHISPLHSRVVIKAKKPFATVKLSVERGELFLDGFVPTYARTPKLILDTLSVPGATARAWKMIDPTFLRDWGPKRHYDLALLQYGTNEGNTSTFNAESYRANLRESLRGFRAAYPTTRCMLIGPTDRGVLVQRSSKKKRKVSQSKDLLFFSRIHLLISQTQADVGKEFTCGFWSWQHAMGGPGSMYRWQRARPALAAFDLIHLTKLGYEESARRFQENVMLKRALGL